ncbi:MAG: HdeD family acid-resistance protein [Halioglobus sp.]|jgi:uncharacterized membrane protein HdeD (DUF308 family)
MADNQQPVPAELGRNVRALCKRTWWVFLLSGIAAVVFGILAFINPGVALAVLALYFAAWVLVDGVVNIVGAVQHRDKDGWVFILLIGILGALVGGYALFNPPVSMVAFLYVVSFMAILLGITLIAMGRKVREMVESEWLLYLTGALSILFGILIAFQPDSAAKSVVWMIATWAIVIGLLRIFFAFFVRNLKEDVGERIRGGTA